MVRISATRVKHDWERIQKIADIEPVMLMRKGRDWAVIISVKEYRRLKRLERKLHKLNVAG